MVRARANRETATGPRALSRYAGFFALVLSTCVALGLAEERDVLENVDNQVKVESPSSCISVPLRKRAPKASNAFGMHFARAWAPPPFELTQEQHTENGHVVPRSEVFGDQSMLLDEKELVLPEQDLFGDLVTLGEYYLELPVGGQVVNVQIDTGSSTLAVPLKQCINCHPWDHRLDLDAQPGRSSFVSCSSPECRPNMCKAIRGQCSVCSKNTRACCSGLMPKQCGFFLQYVDGSGAKGALVQADVSLGGLTVPLKFGAILSVTKGFENDIVEGILGMAFKSLACNPTCVLPLFDALVESGQVKRDVFSVCTGRHGGMLTLGGSNPAMYKGSLEYVPIAKLGKQPHFYNVAVSGAKVGQHDVSVPSFSDGIVDSGSTVLVVAPRAYSALRKHFQTYYCHVPGLCPRSTRRWRESDTKIIRVAPDSSAKLWKIYESANLFHSGNESSKADRDAMFDSHDADTEHVSRMPSTWFAPGYCAVLSDKYIRMLPDITIKLTNGVELTIEPELYMLKYEQRRRFSFRKIVYRCLGMVYLPGLERMENNIILGDVVMQKYYVEHDRENMRLGFAVSQNCVRPSAKPQSSSRWRRNADGSLRRVGNRALSPAALFALAGAAIFAWIVVIALCARDARELEANKRDEYVAIS